MKKEMLEELVKLLLLDKGFYIDKKGNKLIVTGECTQFEDMIQCKKDFFCNCDKMGFGIRLIEIIEKYNEGNK